MKKLFYLLLLIFSLGAQGDQVVSADLAERAQRGLPTLMVALNNRTAICLDGCADAGQPLALAVVKLLGSVEEVRGDGGKERRVSGDVLLDCPDFVRKICLPPSWCSRLQPLGYISIGAAGATVVFLVYNRWRSDN